MAYGQGRGGGYGGGSMYGRGRGGGGRGGSRTRKYDSRKLFIGGVSRRDTDSASFEQFFSSFGEIEDNILMKALDGSGHRGFGFVTFKDQKVTDKVLSMGELELDGKKIDIKMALPEELKPPEGMDGKKIFVGSLPKEDFTSEDLKEYFGQWGHVTDSYVSPGRGFGFITYETTTAACKALIHGSNEGHRIGNIEISAKWPIPKQAARPDPGYAIRGGGFASAGYGGGAFSQYGGAYSNGPGFRRESYAPRSYTSAGGYQRSGRRRAEPY